MIDQQQILGLSALNDAFGGLSALGGGPQQPNRTLPLIMQYQQQMAAKEQQAQEQAKLGRVAQSMEMDGPAAAYRAEGLYREAIEAATQRAPKVSKEMQLFRERQQNPEFAAYLDAQKEPASPMSTVGKIQADLKAGIISPEQAAAAIEKATQGSGLAIDIDADGNMSFRQGAGAGASVPNSITSEAIKGRNAYDSIIKGLDGLEEMASQGGALIPGKKKDRLDVARRSLQLQMKELFNLGVLNGPDLALMDQLLVDMTSIENNALDAVGIANLEERSKANIQQLRQMMTELIAPKLRSAGFEPPKEAAQPAPAPEATRTINGQTYVKRNGKWMMRQ